MAKNDFQYGGWYSYTLQRGTIMTLISPGDCTLQCRMWLWNHDGEFTKWQHPAMWYVAMGWHAVEFARWQHSAMCHVALGSLHWIRQVAAPCSMADGSGMTCHIGIIHLVSILTTPPQSTCHSAPVCEILSKLDRPGQKKWRHVIWWWISAILDFRGSIMSSLKSPYTTSYRSLIDTIALNCLVFETIAFFYILAADRQTDRLTNRWTASMH